jgi:16S rRNA (cytidine1402-2'-O)-methyltransferase
MQVDKYIFLGFPPHKNKRQKYFQEVADATYTVVFYESNHRIKKAIENLTAVLSEGRELCICRELTKKFETVYRGTAKEISDIDISEKGEFVVIVRGK